MSKIHYLKRGDSSRWSSLYCPMRKLVLMIIGRRTPLFLPVLVDNVFEIIKSEILVLYFGVERNLKFISARMLINDTGMAQRSIQNDQKF